MYCTMIVWLFSGNPAWIVVFLMEMNISALCLLVLGVLSLVVCLSTSCKQLVNSEPSMRKKGLDADIWLTRILVQNGKSLLSLFMPLFALCYYQASLCIWPGCLWLLPSMLSLSCTIISVCLWRLAAGVYSSSSRWSSWLGLSWRRLYWTDISGM